MRAQVTGFAIVGILLLIAILGFMWISAPSPTPGPSNGPTLGLENCIENEMNGAIREVGLNGGVPSTFGGLEPIGAAAGPLGLSSTITTSISLNPTTPSIQRHEPDQRTANNYFYAFEHAPAGSTIGSASDTFTEAITSAVETGCGDEVEDLSVSSISFSDTGTTIRARVVEEGRSPRDVSVTVPIPVRRYHQALHHALRRENREPTFLMRGGSTTEFRIASAAMANDDTLVMLETDRPLLGSEPFRYLTIIENRPPVYTMTIGALGSILSCSAGSPIIDSPYDTVAGLVSAGILVDPDDLHDPIITGCIEHPDMHEFTIESGGRTYSLEVPI